MTIKVRTTSQPLHKISVIVPTYNRADLVRLTIDSVLSQLYRNFELVVVDDGSTDHTKEVVGEYLDLPNFTYLYQENSGRSVARNHGLAIAKGEYVMFLDSDDILAEDAIQNLAIAADQNPGSGVVAGARRFIDESDNVIEVEEPMSFRGSFSNRQIYSEKIRELFVCMGSFIVRKDIAQSLGGFNSSFEPAEDFDFFCRYCDITPVTLIEEPVVFIRHHGGNTSMQKLHEASVKISRSNIEKINSGELQYETGRRNQIRSMWQMRLADDLYNLNERRAARESYAKSLKGYPWILMSRHGPHILKQIVATLALGDSGRKPDV